MPSPLARPQAAIMFSFHINCEKSAHRFKDPYLIRCTVQLSSNTIGTPPAPPSPPSPAVTTLALRLAAICASTRLCSSYQQSALLPKPGNPFLKPHLRGSNPHEGSFCTYRNEGFLHPLLSLCLVLAGDLITLVHSFTARKPVPRCRSIRLATATR